MFLFKNSNGYYYIFFNDELTGKRKKISCKTKSKSEAIKFVSYLKSNQSKQSQGQNLQKSQVQYLTDLKTEILKYVLVNMEKSTCQIYSRVLNDMKRIFGNKPIRLICPKDIEEYKSIRSKEVKPATVNIDINTMKAIFNIAIRLGWTDINPVKNIRKMSIPEKENLCFSDEQINLILNNADDEMRNVIQLGLLTGCRLNEIANLQWKDVNLKDRILTIRNKENFKTKTGRIRDIPISDKLNDLFYSMLNGDKASAENVLLMFNPSEYIFKNPKGYKYNKDIISKRFKDKLRKLNFNEKYHFHCLRHTFITSLIKAGVNINYVKEIAGHSEIRTTMNYIHISTEDLRQAVNKINIW